MSDYLSELRRIVEGSKSAVFFGGAGVSTESGIPDFRSESGLYKAQTEYGRSPESLISHSAFLYDTELFFDYYKHNLVFSDALPNNAHKALAKLEEDGIVSGIVTQNVDGLHQTAGSQAVYELHGSVKRNTCMDCGSHYDLEYIMDDEHCIDSDGNVTSIPRCDKCGGIVKPDVVLYEEPLDDATVMGAVNAISHADTLIVGGTSLVVYPAAGFLSYFGGSNLILINKTETDVDHKANLVIHEPIGQVLSIFL
jgi:NAD-dependent deacetylase